MRTTRSRPAKRLETRKLADLRSFHRQDVLYHPLSDAEFERLVRDIEKNGLNQPIEITTGNVICDGHQRLRAIHRLGWDEVGVWVRDDLKSEQAIERRHIEANWNRRQLDQLDQVRLAVRVYEIEAGLKPGGLLNGWDAPKLTKRVAAQIEKSPRHTQRLLNVLRAPMEVQKAVSEGSLKFTLAAKVYTFPQPVQIAIAAEIRNGGNPAAIVEARLPKRRPRRKVQEGELDGIVVILGELMAAVDGAETEICKQCKNPEHALVVLKTSARWCQTLCKHLKAHRAAWQKALGALKEQRAAFRCEGDDE